MMDSYLFAKVDAHFIAELMQTPVLVSEVLLDVGFDHDGSLSTDGQLSMLEQRWQGLEQTFSLEEITSILAHIFQPSSGLHKTLFTGGRKSDIVVDDYPVFVLSPKETEEIHHELQSHDPLSLRNQWANEKLLESLPSTSSDHIEAFWMLYQGLTTFFASAAKAGDCTLRVATRCDSST